MTEDKAHNTESGELMYVKCAYCGKWMDVKPGNMNLVSHSLCDNCLKAEMKKVESLRKAKPDSP